MINHPTLKLSEMVMTKITFKTNLLFPNGVDLIRSEERRISVK